MSLKATIIILGILHISLFIPTTFAANQDQERIYGSKLTTSQE